MHQISKLLESLRDLFEIGPPKKTDDAELHSRLLNDHLSYLKTLLGRFNDITKTQEEEPEDFASYMQPDVMSMLRRAEKLARDVRDYIADSEAGADPNDYLRNDFYVMSKNLAFFANILSRKTSISDLSERLAGTDFSYVIKHAQRFGGNLFAAIADIIRGDAAEVENELWGDYEDSYSTLSRLSRPVG